MNFASRLIGLTLTLSFLQPLTAMNFIQNLAKEHPYSVVAGTSIAAALGIAGYFYKKNIASSKVQPSENTHSMVPETVHSFIAGTTIGVVTGICAGYMDHQKLFPISWITAGLLRPMLVSAYIKDMKKRDILLHEEIVASVSYLASWLAWIHFMRLIQPAISKQTE